MRTKARFVHAIDAAAVATPKRYQSMSSIGNALPSFASTAIPGERRLALASGQAAPSAASQREFVPAEPTTLETTGLLPNDVEPLVLKLLLTSGATVGRRIAEQVRLPFGLMSELLRTLRTQLLLAISKEATMGDF